MQSLHHVPFQPDDPIENERKYFLSLLTVAEELLSLLPEAVQNKYGIIKGTLALKLGGVEATFQPDSAIHSALTTGIAPQVNASAAAAAYVTAIRKLPTDIHLHVSIRVHLPCPSVSSAHVAGFISSTRSLYPPSRRSSTTSQSMRGR